jgi:hypothetical protein
MRVGACWYTKNTSTVTQCPHEASFVNVGVSVVFERRYGGRGGIEIATGTVMVSCLIEVEVAVANLVSVRVVVPP